MEKKALLVIVAGFAGSGKSTLADKLAKALKAKCVHASGVLKEMRKKKAAKIDLHACRHNTGWWESEEGKAYMRRRLEDSTMDKELDKHLLKLIAQAKKKKQALVLDSWTMPWLSKEGFKIWLRASAEKRAGRIAGRDGIPAADALKKLRERDAQTAQIYKNIYGFSLGEDLRPFNLVIETDELDEEGVFAEALGEVKKVIDVNSGKRK
ncbi:MAG: cytidylate kinase family protein [Candidatus Diapherotrites archaeon]